MATVNVSANANASEIQESYGGGNWYYSELLAYIGKSDSYWTREAGFRFTNVTVPKNATITYVKITFVADANLAGQTPNLKIQGIDEDNTAVFSSGDKPRLRTKTTAQVDWDYTGSDTSGSSFYTPDLKTIISEITTRAGWASGNAMGFYIKDDGGSNSEYLSIKEYEDGSANAAILTIEYTTGSISLSPSLSLSPSPSLSSSLSPSLSVSPSPEQIIRGIKIVKSGFDVKTETDPENMIFTSELGALGFRKVVNVTDQTDANGKIEAEYSHNLGYIPLVAVSVTNYDGDKIIVPGKWESDWVGGEVLEENFYFYVDNSKIYVKVYVHHYEPIQGGSDTDLSGQSYTFEIIIYFNELNDEY